MLKLTPAWLKGSIASSPAWVKTTLYSWFGTGAGLGIAQYQEGLKSWAILIGGIIIPIASFGWQICRDKKK